MRKPVPLKCVAIMSSLSWWVFFSPAHADWRRDNKDECARIDARLVEIATKRRAGYGAEQGRRLQTQREELEKKRREKCR